MKKHLEWALPLACVALGYAVWGWQGLVMALSLVVFWLLLQFSRAMRVMRTAGQAPVGTVPSAVMLHARLQTGLPLMKILTLTRSLGEKLTDEPETWRWRDGAGDSVRVVMRDGRCAEWALHRAAADDEPAGSKP
jgi:hypothetical protein